MTVELRDNEVLTPPCRLVFPCLVEPRPRTKDPKDANDLWYGAGLLVPPEADLRGFANAIKAAMKQEWGDRTVKLRGRGLPIHEASEYAYDGFEEGWKFIRSYSRFKPGLTDQKLAKVVDPQKFYAGSWCNFLLSAQAWRHDVGGQGVSFYLQAIQFVSDDRRLDGRRNATEVFQPIAGAAEGFEDDGEDDVLNELFG